MLKKMLLLFVLMSLPFITAAQTVTDPAAKSPEDEKLNKAAVDFLRETLADVGNLRSLENRISFTSEIAGLMWYHDETEARNMFRGVTTDFQQLILQYDSQMNALGSVDGADQPDVGSASFFLEDESSRGKIERKFRTALAVRQQIAMAMAEHDPDLAFSFYYDGLAGVTNPDFRKQGENSDKYFEFQLMAQIAAKAPDKAVKFASRSLKDGLNYQHVEILKKIYAKDPDKAADFAADLLSKVKSDKLKREDFWVVNSLISFGSETLEKSQKDGKAKAIYSRSDLQDLAEALAKALLDLPRDNIGEAGSYLGQIQKYAPSRAAQIKARMSPDERNGANSTFTASNRAYAAVTNAEANAYGANMARAQKAREDREKNQQQVMDDVMKIGNKDLPKDQRDTIISQARKILLTTPGRDKKVAGLSLLAAQVAKAGDKDLANQIMKDAESLINPNPKNYQDFLLIWMLAGGYASVNPDKAFPLLEETIGRVNETITAFVKAAEFIDVNEEAIQDGEVQVGAFGGAMISGLTRELGIADSTIKVLSKDDFDKTKNLTYRFERPEVRILAKMLVLRSILGEKDQQQKVDLNTDAPPYDDGN